MKNKKTRLSPTDRRRAIGLLRHFRSLNYTLADCADPRRLRIDPHTLLELAREAGTVFRDEREFAKRADEAAAT
jgi:hypothetical protein